MLRMGMGMEIGIGIGMVIDQGHFLSSFSTISSRSCQDFSMPSFTSHIPSSPHFLFLLQPRSDEGKSNPECSFTYIHTPSLRPFRKDAWKTDTMIHPIHILGKLFSSVAVNSTSLLLSILTFASSSSNSSSSSSTTTTTIPDFTASITIQK